jgi:hypothetical protein
MKPSTALCALVLLVSACGQRNDRSYTTVTSDPLLYSRTEKNLNDIVLENNFAPMVAARNYVYANIAAYECIAAGDSAYPSLSGQIRHLPALPKPQNPEIDFPLASMLALVKVGNAVTFPEGSMMGHYEQLWEMADSVGMPDRTIRETVKFADSISAAILAWSKRDNYAKTRGASRFNVLDSPGRWTPTPPMYSTALEPHWRHIRPMMMDSAAQFMPPRPPAFNLSDKNGVYYKSLMEVKNTVEGLTEEQKHIAEFWDDNPFKMNVTGHVMYATKKFSPAGHWMNIVGIAAKRAGADFKQTVAAYAATSIALFDAFISCWDEKFRSNYIRPETAINTHFDREWRPFIQTPPFPSYTSGHSTISAAAAEVMTKHFGDRLAFTDTSLLEFGIANREIRSFRAAAQEASVSRLYGGIHYRFDLDEGNKAGAALGSWIADRLKMPK